MKKTIREDRKIVEIDNKKYTVISRNSKFEL